MAQIPPDDARKLEGVMGSAFDSGFSGVMVMMAIAGLLGAVICFALISRRAAK